jgi:hypothetical protein
MTSTSDEPTPFIPPSGKPIIIGIIGTEGAGKDTLADHLVAEYGFLKYSMAQPIKDIARIMFGWSDELLNGRTKDLVDPVTGIKPREFFKWFGTDIAQHEIHSRFPGLLIPPREMWVHSMRQFIGAQQNKVQPTTRRISISPKTKPYHSTLRAIRNNPVRVIIPDIRFLHEAKAIRELGGILIHLTTPYAPLQASQYDIPTLTDHTTNWLHCTFNNPRISIPDFHSKIDEWLCNLFPTVIVHSTEEDIIDYEDDELTTARPDDPCELYTSNMSIYI